jgi:hypothetical protein
MTEVAEQDRAHAGATTRAADDATPTSVRVAIVAYANPLDELWRCVRALLRSIDNAFETPGVELNAVTIELGDCSPRRLLTDEDAAALAEACPSRVRFEYRWFGRNLGHSAGTNALCDNAPEDALLLLNPDTYASPTLFLRMLRALRDGDVVAVDARQIPAEHPKHYDEVTGTTSWASGACMLVRTPHFRGVGGFDAEHFPSYVNDVDLSWRLRLAGGRIVHEPTAVVFHDKRLTVEGGVRPTSSEEYAGLLGRLVLLSKYGKDDDIADLLAYLEEHGTATQASAAEEFRRRRASGALPETVAGADHVAEFTEGEYGRRRF